MLHCVRMQLDTIKRIQYNSRIVTPDITTNRISVMTKTESPDLICSSNSDENRRCTWITLYMVFQYITDYWTYNEVVVERDLYYARSLTFIFVAKFQMDCVVKSCHFLRFGKNLKKFKLFFLCNSMGSVFIPISVA